MSSSFRKSGGDGSWERNIDDRPERVVAADVRGLWPASPTSAAAGAAGGVEPPVAPLKETRVEKRPSEPIVRGEKIVVAVDLDEVLCAFIEALAEYHNDAYATGLTADSFHSYHFTEVWGGTQEETGRKVSEFYASKYFDGSHRSPEAPAGLTPLRLAAETLRALKASGNFKLVVVTSRQHIFAERTRAWLDTHYSGIFDDVLFGNHYSTTGHVRTKSEMCKEIGAAVLIDDNIVYALECAATLPMVILFGAYAWNRTSDDASHINPTSPLAKLPPPTSTTLPPNVLRACNWRHVASLLNRLRQRSDSYNTTGGGGRKGRGGGYGSGYGPPHMNGIPRTPAACVSLLGIRESLTLLPPGAGYGSGYAASASASSSSATATTPGQYVDLVRRQFEVQPCIAVTGTGHETRLVAEVADMLTASHEATVTNIRTGMDAAAPGRARVPRLTITLQRTTVYLEKRFPATTVSAATAGTPRRKASLAAASSTGTGSGTGIDALTGLGPALAAALPSTPAAPPGTKTTTTASIISGSGDGEVVARSRTTSQDLLETREAVAKALSSPTAPT